MKIIYRDEVNEMFILFFLLLSLKNVLKITRHIFLMNITFFYVQFHSHLKNNVNFVFSYLRLYLNTLISSYRILRWILHLFARLKYILYMNIYKNNYKEFH